MPNAVNYELAQAEGFVGTVQEWLASLKGADGAVDGADGAAGRDGADGKSAYEIVVENGIQERNGNRPQMARMADA